MKYFFPDSHNTVDPTFDFSRETGSTNRVRQRQDQYCHEIFSKSPYDGLLISKSTIDGFTNIGGKYTFAQRNRLLRSGAREFFRTPNLPLMGDCGAFTYIREEFPPFTVDETLDFYEACGFDYGISVDHAILAYQPKFDDVSHSLNKEIINLPKRREITLQLAAEFYAKHRSRKLKFTPLGVAQGWSPKSYVNSAKELQKIGFEYIALGGIALLKTADVLDCLRAVNEVRKPTTRLHLLGVNRIEAVTQFAKYGVESFDSSSLLRRAFKDDRDNYYTPSRTYAAVRVPQVAANPQLLRRIKSGQISQDQARTLEGEALTSLRLYAAGELSLAKTLDAVDSYDKFCDPEKNYRELYQQVLYDRPWTKCPCEICKQLDYQVILFRGTQRNRRRGFHNVWTFYEQLKNTAGIYD